MRRDTVQSGLTAGYLPYPDGSGGSRSLTDYIIMSVPALYCAGSTTGSTRLRTAGWIDHNAVRIQYMTNCKRTKYLEVSKCA